MDLRPNNQHQPLRANRRTTPVQPTPGYASSTESPAPSQNPSTLKDLIDSIQLQDRRAKQFYRVVGVKRFMILFAVGVFAIVGGLAGSIYVASRSSANVSQPTATLVAGASETKVDESPITEEMLALHGAPAKAPKFLAIPSIGLSTTRIFKISSLQDGSIEQTENIADVGWYDQSSSPASAQGNVLLLGHVSGTFSEGAFYSLYRVAIGDTIEVLSGDDTIYRYRVTQKKELTDSEANIDQFLEPKKADTATLTLITYSGEFNPVAKTYENRLVVFALRD